MARNLSVICYNLHGFNQGSHGVKDLMKTTIPDVFMLQEHWLSPDNLHKLNSLSNEYFVYASSAMTECVNSGPLVGRPFGGTAIIVNKKFASITIAIASSERFTIVKLAEWLFITVYLPSAGTFNRDSLLCDILAELDVFIDAHPNCPIMVAGDLNTDLMSNVSTSAILNNFINDNNLHRCDVLFPTANRTTYFNEATSASSTIDYIFNI